ncbi:hypothetical protein [Singulisphaera sp. PoT]|uniref:hypothetical protein n=1 Tax=Singulisphaera sp. PoT TaxID=3411797 RepID=UPI003BF49FAB
MTTERVESGAGFSVLDGVAMILGAAVAAVHIRGVIREEMTGLVLIVIWGTFAWVALTASGPFLLLVRGFARPVSGYPRVGDVLWALLGLPWLATSVLRSMFPRVGPERFDFISAALSIGIASVCFISLGTIWTTWVMVPPDQASKTALTPWTNRLGFILAVAWPVQCGVGMVVVG